MYTETLARFVSGDATILELDGVVEIRLTKLREILTLTKEQHALSFTELMIEEWKEGFRDILDVYVGVFLVLETLDVVA